MAISLAPFRCAAFHPTDRFETLPLLVRQAEEDDNERMKASPELEAYFELCKRIYERHQREGTWPWTGDSTDTGDVIDSDQPPNKL
jgi:hypothetical protein